MDRVGPCPLMYLLLFVLRIVSRMIILKCVTSQTIWGLILLNLRTIIAAMREFESKNHHESHRNGPYLIIATRKNLTNLVEELSEESGMSASDIINEMLRIGSSLIALNIRKGVENVEVRLDKGKFVGVEIRKSPRQD